jgi:hypothetical protein
MPATHYRPAVAHRQVWVHLHTADRAASSPVALDGIGKALQKQGITLEEFIETGREARGRLLSEE